MKPGLLLRRLRAWFIQGIALVAPLAITLAFLLWLGRSLELFVGGLLQGILPASWYIPGLGLAVALLATLAIGLIANLFLVRTLVRLAERLLDRIPLVKTLFQGLKDVTRFVSGDGEKDLGRVVAVDILGVRLVGFVTQESARLPGPAQEEGEGRDDPNGGLDTGSGDRSGDQGQGAGGDRIAVYLPMSYQIGGYTLYVTKDRVRSLDVSTEQALRAVITGGATGPRQGGRSTGA